jgi:single-stranded DNA-binding protein
MNYLNKVELAGVLAKDVEIRDAGTSRVANLTVELKEYYQDKEYSSLVQVTVWGRAAEPCEGRRAGDAVRVVGALREEKWTGKVDGKPHSRLKVRANEVEFD